MLSFAMWPRQKEDSDSDDHPQRTHRADPQPLTRARSQFEAEGICERLRAVGIKCNWLEEIDPSKPFLLGTMSASEMRFEVYVDSADLDRAQQSLSTNTADPAD
jgi:hypothetical protein